MLENIKCIIKIKAADCTGCVARMKSYNPIMDLRSLNLKENCKYMGKGNKRIQFMQYIRYHSTEKWWRLQI